MRQTMYSSVFRGLGILAVGLMVGQANGSLIDWHVNPAATTYSQSAPANWTPYGGANLNNAAAATTGYAGGIDYTIWDGYGPHGSATAGAHHNLTDFGGQAFDVKAMYMRNDADSLYIGVVTGFDPAGLTRNGIAYTLGDVAINPNFAAATAQFGIRTLTGAAGSSGTTSLVAGGTWDVPNAATGVPGPPYSNYASGGTTIATDVHYSYTDLGLSYADATTHGNQEMYLLEFSVPLSDLTGTSFTTSFGPSCANDMMTVTHSTGPTSVPEPTAAALLGGTGLLALTRRPRRRRGHAA